MPLDNARRLDFQGAQRFGGVEVTGTAKIAAAAMQVRVPVTHQYGGIRKDEHDSNGQNGQPFPLRVAGQAEQPLFSVNLGNILQGLCRSGQGGYRMGASGHQGVHTQGATRPLYAGSQSATFNSDKNIPKARI